MHRWCPKSAGLSVFEQLFHFVPIAGALERQPRQRGRRSGNYVANHLFLVLIIAAYHTIDKTMASELLVDHSLREEFKRALVRQFVDRLQPKCGIISIKFRLLKPNEGDFLEHFKVVGPLSRHWIANEIHINKLRIACLGENERPRRKAVKSKIA